MQSSVLVLAAIASTVIVLFPYNSVGGVIVFGATVAIISIVTLPLLAPREDRRFLKNILILALLVKLLATGIRLFMNNVVFGAGDLNRFSLNGSIIAEQVRAGDFSVISEQFSLGSPAMDVFTGLMFTVTGSSFFGAFLFSGFLGFLAAVIFYRTFRIAFPNGNNRMFAYLIFFYPALLYWPTGFGKDVIVFFMLSLTVWGTARFILLSRLSGLWVAVPALAMIFMIRTEVGLMATIAFITAFVLRTPASNRKAFTIQLVGVPVILMVGFIVIASATSFLGLANLSLGSALELLTSQSSRVFDEGRTGSNFVAPVVGTPGWIPGAFTTVLFRPFPWEVHNIAALLQSFDGVLLGGILFFSFPRIARSLRSEGQSPVIIFSIVFILMSVLALATLGNFGLLARQRVIVLPFLFFILAAAKPVARRLRARKSIDAATRPSTGIAGSLRLEGAT